MLYGSQGCFVTGTDTQVGKTVVTAALAVNFRHRGIDVGVMKPIETGVVSMTSRQSDAGRLKAAAKSGDEWGLIRPYGFRTPVAPLTASRRERKPIALARIVERFHVLRRHHALMLVEGVGGVQVPLTRTHDVIDLIIGLRLPVIVVGRVELGGINHARLTVEALRSRRIPIIAVVLNRTVRVEGTDNKQQERSTIALVRELTTVPVIGPLPYTQTLTGRWSEAIAALAKTTAINTLVELLDQSATPIPGRRASRQQPLIRRR